MHSLRKTQRTGLVHKLIGTRSFSLPSFSTAHITHMHCQQKHQYQCTTYTRIYAPPFFPIPAGHAQWTSSELASALVVTNLGHGGRPYGTIWLALFELSSCLASSSNGCVHCRFLKPNTAWPVFIWLCWTTCAEAFL